MIEKEIQKEANKIQNEIDTKCIIIYGKPRNGKTILAASICFDSYKKRTYANFNVYKNWTSFTKKYNSFRDLERIRFSYEHGVIAVDESWINVNSKDWMKKASRIMEEILFLSGKKNCDMIMIAQSYESVNVNFRRNASAIFQVVKIKRKWKKPLFIVERQIPDGEKMKKISSYSMDTLTIMEEWRISYDTLEESRMVLWSTKEEEEEEQKKYKKQKD